MSLGSNPSSGGTFKQPFALGCYKNIKKDFQSGKKHPHDYVSLDASAIKKIILK